MKDNDTILPAPVTFSSNIFGCFEKNFLLLSLTIFKFPKGRQGTQLDSFCKILAHYAKCQIRPNHQWDHKHYMDVMENI